MWGSILACSPNAVLIDLCILTTGNFWGFLSYPQWLTHDSSIWDKLPILNLGQASIWDKLPLLNLRQAFTAKSTLWIIQFIALIYKIISWIYTHLWLTLMSCTTLLAVLICTKFQDTCTKYFNNESFDLKFWLKKH